MTPTSASILDDFAADITAFEVNTPRALQVETGGSQIYGCVAEAIFRLRGTQPSERLSWQAVVGKAIHEYAATARAKVREGAICEQRFAYRGVPCSVDYLDPEQRLLLDIKTKDDADEVEQMLTGGPSDRQLAQLHLGAAAANSAGYDIAWVGLLCLPRDGELDDARVVGPFEFDQAQADAAAEWSQNVETAAADPDVDPRDHRGQPAFWCYRFCPFVGECRGHEPNAAADLSELAVPGEAYREAQDARDAAAERMRALRPTLLGAKGRAGRVSISTARGSVTSVDELAVDELTDLWRYVYGNDAPLPSKTVEKTFSSRLAVKWAKEKTT